MGDAPKPRDVDYRGATVTLPALGDWFATPDDRGAYLLALTSGATVWIYELAELPGDAAALTAIAERAHFQDTKVTRVGPRKQHGKTGLAFSGSATIRPSARRGGGTFTLEGVALAGYAGRRVFVAVAFALDGIGPNRLLEARQVLASLR